MVTSRALAAATEFQSCLFRPKVCAFDAVFQVFVPEKSEILFAQLEFTVFASDLHHHRKHCS